MGEKKRHMAGDEDAHLGRTKHLTTAPSFRRALKEGRDCRDEAQALVSVGYSKEISPKFLIPCQIENKLTQQHSSMAAW